jgi:FkbM family methyltransferase
MVMAFFGIRHGVGLRSKLKIVALSLLNVAPGSFRKRFRRVEKIVRLLTPNFSEVLIEFDGYTYQLIDQESIYLVAFHEDWMGRYLRVGRGDVFVDVGANIGKYSITLSGIAGRVVSVEADPDNYERLRQNIELNGIDNVTAVKMVAWDKSEILRFHPGEFSGAGTAKEDLPDREYVKDSIEVRAESMDARLRSLGVSTVDWIKIDVEGAEYEVLKGLEETLRTHRPRIVAELMKSNVGVVLAFMENMNYIARPISESESPYQIYYCFHPALP